MNKTLCIAAALGLAIALSASASLAALAMGDVSGVVTDTSGAPIAGARVVFASSRVRVTATSDASGAFVLHGIDAQTYVVTAEAAGFGALSPRVVAVAANTTTNVRLELERASTGNVATLGRVTVNGKVALSTASAPSAVIDPQDLAGRGIEDLASELAEQIAVTMTRPAGGAPGLPQSASLRGPDPSETLIDVDGHVVNNANTGDFDLELLDPAEFSSVQVVYGVGPASLDGANTQGGSIDFHTIDPTEADQGLLRFSIGNFDTTAYTLQATGTDEGRLGYAFSFHRYTTAGAVNGYDVAYQPNPNDPATATTTLGSAIDATSSLAKLRYSPGDGDGFIELTYRDTAAFRDLSAPLSFPNVPSSFGPGSLFTAYPGAALLTNSPAIGVDIDAPLGTRSSAGVEPASLILRHLTNINDQSAPDVPVSLGNPYLFSERDVVGDDSAEYDRYLDDGTFTLLTDVRSEDLRLPADAPLAHDLTDARETQRSFATRYEWAPTSHLHYTAAAYVSRYDTFGTSVDPRTAVVWTPNSDNVVRFSFGTGFRAPLLTERAINDTLTAEHTSEFELGYEHRFSEDALAPTAEVDSYDTSLRDPIFFIPCANVQNGQFCFIENLANVAYQGIELRTDVPLSPYITARGSYGIDIAYPKNDPAAFDPSAPSVVSGQQFQGIPPRKALLSIDGRISDGWGFSTDAAYESVNNELNRPSYWLFDASVAKMIDKTSIALGVQNLTNQFADRFTLIGLGPEYPTPTGPVPTNAYSLPGRTLTLTITQNL
ncbi:MAG TPA: TonB-dependent receptor [Candidatus Eremiobacteraceae bacterium]|nr:TonB-dependent receptor [Candidatus Eremiobacteraceae bacterium]